MSVNFCPKCGTKKEQSASFCSRCQFNFNSLRIEPVTTNTTKKQNKSLQKKTSNVLFSVISYITNGIYVFWLIWLYAISKEMVKRGHFPELGVIVSPVVLVVLFYIPSAFLYYRKGGLAFFISAIIGVIMLIPEMLFLIDFKAFYNAIGDMYGDIDHFLIVPAIPLLFTLIVCAFNIVIIFLRLIKKGKQRKGNPKLKVS